jgi:ABC-type uncharacterized transport system involved in gliding motility auxiliary subunit
VDYIDPYKKPQLAKAAGVRTEGQIFVQTGDKKEEARSLTEEEVTGAIIRSLKSGERNVCAVSGSGEKSFDETGRDGYSQFKESLERNNYKTRTISLLEKPEVPKDCTILLVAGPRFDYVQPVVDAVRKFVEGGGRAMILVDPPLKLGREDVAENQPLMTLLDSWGVTAGKNLVLDTSGIGQIFGLSAAVPLVTTYETHAVVREMKGVATAFPLPRSVDVKTGGGTTPEKLFSTSENSFATSNLSSPEIEQGPNDMKGPISLGVAGTIKSGGQGTGEGRFVVAGSSNFIANSILRFNGNRDLALNMANWLSSDEDLISIRPKEPEDRRLSLTRRQMSVVWYASIFGLPLLIVLAGLGVWWRRR